MLVNSYPTFGSFAPMRKISPTTVRLWTAALNAVPEARMLVMGKGLHTEAMQNRFLEPFVQQGIDSTRFILRGSASLEEYLRTYNEVDLILDTAPWNGHTTTLHALWMGVPTLSVKGAHHAARFGEMVLKAADLENFLALDLADFSRRAKAITDDPASLSLLRGQLRERLLASSLCDHVAMARRFEEACLAMWRIPQQ
jgi:predicted O-linked N-acetylglucosamine transferase (SPINDLY family)